MRKIIVLFAFLMALAWPLGHQVEAQRYLIDGRQASRIIYQVNYIEYNGHQVQINGADSAYVARLQEWLSGSPYTQWIYDDRTHVLTAYR